MNKCYPEQPSVHTEEGERAHELAAIFLRGEEVDTSLYAQEMIDAAKMYADDVNAVRDDNTAPLHIEQTIKEDVISTANFGTPDTWFYSTSLNRLFVWDFKYGHRGVSPFLNWQGVNYFALIVSTLNKAGITPKTLEFRIIQPRAFLNDGPIRSWCITFESFCQYREQLRANANKCITSPTLNAGPHCRDCKARHACEALREEALWAAEYVFEPIPREPSPDQLGRELSILTIAEKAIGHLKAGIEAQVESLIKDGNIIPGWSMERGRGSRKWAASDMEILQYAEVLGIDITKEPAPITPAQAKNAGFPEGLINQLSMHVPGAKKLAKIDVNEQSARLFGPAETK